jgi:hypothetical protein
VRLAPEQVVRQCYGCGQVADNVARETSEGMLCRFCQTEREGRCFWCGAPGDPWPLPEARLTIGWYDNAREKHSHPW